MKIIHRRSEIESAFRDALHVSANVHTPVSTDVGKTVSTGLSESQFILRTPLIGWPNVCPPSESSPALRWLATWLYAGIVVIVFPFLMIIDYLFMDYSLLLLQIPIVFVAWAYLTVGFGAVDSEKYVVVIPRFLFFSPLSQACRHELRHVAKGDV